VTQGREPGREAYVRSGVDVEAAARAVEMIREVAGEASRPEVRSGIGGFAGLIDLGDGRLLAAGADGVGTKLEIARQMGRFDTVGVDCVAMCANDVVCTGAEPLFFLDYLAVEKLVPGDVAAIVSGVAEGCRRAGCALLGGETAEHPGTLVVGGFDLAGFCVGIVREGDVLDPKRVHPGDVLIGLRSSGLHANGFSLVRRIVAESNADLHAIVPELGRTLGDELLEPTVFYVSVVLALARAGLAVAAAHITGGGLIENLPRALPARLGAVIDRSAWAPQPVFAYLAKLGGLDTKDLFGVLNMGIGMVVVVRAIDADQALRVAVDAGGDPFLLGEAVETSGILLQ
jgi:phosphoribosylformylglycinamidine cyclo-ligase